MSNFVYWPYDELSLTLDKGANAVTVKSPWLEASTEVASEILEPLADLAAKMENQSLSGQDLGLVNWFFKQLSEYPFCYILPGNKPVKDIDHHKVSEEPLSELSMRDLLNHVSRNLKDANFTEKDVDTFLSTLSRTSWEWDIETASQFSKVGEDEIHPESFFSVARRYHMLELIDQDSDGTGLEFISELQGEEFKRAASILIRQNHYVTQQCNRSLAPALNIAGRAKEAVTQFMKEEEGHDLILGQAIKTIHDDPEKVPVTICSRIVMGLLRYVASKNFLGFAVLVDAFERSNYQKMDPMAQILQKGGYEKAAKHINRHMEINDAGGHENIAMGLLKDMAPVSLEYVKEAMRFAEVLTLATKQLPKAIRDQYEATKEAPELLN